jgi:hypothetical protein
MRNGAAYERPMSAPPTSATGSLSSPGWPTPTVHGNHNRTGASATSGDGLGTAVRRWPTPTARDHKGPRARRTRQQHPGPLLPEAVLLWPTPTAADAQQGSAADQGGNPPLPGAARLWPTPTASNPNEQETLESWTGRRQRERARGRNGNGMGTPLGIAVRLWPTPTAADGSSGPGQAQTAEGSPDLRTTVTAWATPTAADSQSRGSATGDRGGWRSLVDQAPSALNPAWVEVLMGFPEGWTRIAGRLPPARRRRGSRPARSGPARSPTAPGG